EAAARCSSTLVAAMHCTLSFLPPHCPSSSHAATATRRRFLPPLLHTDVFCSHCCSPVELTALCTSRWGDFVFVSELTALCAVSFAVFAPNQTKTAYSLKSKCIKCS